MQGEPVQGLRSLDDGFIPPIIDISLLDRKIFVTNDDAIVWTRKLLDEEGVFAGVSTGAIASIAVRIAGELDEGNVVFVVADDGWKYLSSGIYTLPVDRSRTWTRPSGGRPRRPRPRPARGSPRTPRPGRVKIAAELLAEIVAHAQEDPRIECCGIVAVLSGEDGGAGQTAARVFRAEQRPRQRDEVRDRPDGAVRVCNDEIEEEGWEIGAIYHSHVRSAPYPSQTDIGFAASWPGVEWIIVGLAGGAEPDVRSYLIDGGARSSEVADRGRREREREAARSARAAARTYPAQRALLRELRDAAGVPAGQRAGRAASASARRARSSLSTPKARSSRSRVRGNQPEAELIEALLLEEGIPSMPRRSGGFDVPDFLAAGPRDILVPESARRGRARSARAASIAADEQRPGAEARRRPAGRPQRRPLRW